MDRLDSAREIVVEVIAGLEDAIEALMSAQAPGSTHRDISESSELIRSLSNSLIQHAQAIENILKQTIRDDD
ncbi:hypothetical protein RYZ27_01275 [Hyphomonas sp. FCG-A18]|uniref:hypothetical protein n=1 Tax=Hyphomonas sp. FCG-A18 TaxID=3080019 RepID=UPI002B2B2810|nr:hypothetical protein RYZ27_01275 [Hyphomonas sp. FCG-A18]